MSYERLNDEDLVQVLGDGLLAAICSHDVQRVERFLETENISPKDIDNIPLGIACRSNDLDIVKTLLKFGVDVNVKANLQREYNIPGLSMKKRKWSAIVFACSTPGERCELVKCLIEAGCDIHTRDSIVNLPLKYAIKHKNIPLIKLLIESGVDVNATLRSGEMFGTEIAAATANCNVEIIKLLIDAGVCTSRGDNCLEISLDNNFLKGVEIFSKTNFAQQDLNDGHGHMVRLREMRNRASLAFYEDLLGFMSEDLQVIPVLHYACAYLHEDPWQIVKCLLEVIPDIHRKDKQGFNCLQYACSRLHVKTIKVLLERGVTPETDGWSKMWKFMPPVNDSNLEIYPKFLELMRLAGFHIDAETISKVVQSMFLSQIDEDEDRLDHMWKAIRACVSPPSLKEISRIQLRHSLRGNIDESKLSEHIHGFLIEYLKFVHLY